MLNPQNVECIPTDTVIKNSYRYYARVEFVKYLQMGKSYA